MIFRSLDSVAGRIVILLILFKKKEQPVIINYKPLQRDIRKITTGKLGLKRTWVNMISVNLFRATVLLPI